MAGETVVTVIGNLTADPELRYAQNGLPVAGPPLLANYYLVLGVVIAIVLVTYRLLVRGHRIAFDPVVAAAAQPVRPGLVMEPWMYWLIGAAAASFLSLGVALGTAVRARSRRPAPALGGRASVVRQRRRGNRFGRRQRRRRRGGQGQANA